MASLGECWPIHPSDLDDMVSLAKSIQPDLVVIGPEDPLIAGLADDLRDSGFAVFGPDAAAARLEGSKAYAKEIMLSAGVPTAPSATFDDAASATAYAAECADKGHKVVVKADGLALGKGVVVCNDFAEARTAIRAALLERVFGSAGDKVLVEQRLVGREFSLLTLCSDGEIQSLPIAQDYKRIGNHDQGPNTGGMGTYSPVPWVNEELVRRTEETVVRPVLTTLASQGLGYRGVLFSGLMLVGSELFCLEYNVRFGDPETQSIMARLGPGLAEALLACAHGKPIPPVPVLKQAAVTVVAASAGYPGAVRKGDKVTIGALPDGCVCFQAGATRRGDDLITNGGRVLAITSMAGGLRAARDLAYQGMGKVHFDGMQFRNDIAAPAKSR
jgi:phosphoribosylamine--glycine ligase